MSLVKNVGLHADRLAPERDNPLELIYARLWEAENEPSIDSARQLGQILDGSFTECDRVVAATIIQWLGSPVGYRFVESALREYGREIREIKP